MLSVNPMKIDGIKSYALRSIDGYVCGVIYDSITDMEYDVRQLGRRKWNVNDDQGRDFTGYSLRNAINKARKEN